MIDEADRDGDGEICEDEFIRIMKKNAILSIFGTILINKNHYINWIR